MLNNVDIENYLMERDNRDEQSMKKKKTVDDSTDANQDKGNRHLIAHRSTARILERRYSLTITGYKYLIIGIDVTLPSHVTITLGDCHGKEILFSPDIWSFSNKNTLSCPFCSTTKTIKEYVRRLRCTLEI
ncbi:PREDICTED: uncharacterized protein LOC105152710 [Acromyrmex echinatior]|nr:PREDICTED: uncharacterized protein LOC105152710 [Acromyrmex echinatior]